MLGFLIGAVAGGLAVAYWHGDLSNFGTRQMPRLRNQAADKVEAAERALIRMVGNVSTRTRAGLRADRSRQGEGNAGAP
jgi:hypothetical protein